MRRVERSPITIGPEAKKNRISPNEAVFRVAYFVMENLPEVPFLRKMAEDKREIGFTIGDKKWSLRISDDQAVISSGKTGNIRHLILTDEASDGKKTQFGIFTEEDFVLGLGVYLGNLGNGMFVYFREPINLAKVMKELREDDKERIRKSLRKTHDARRTAVALNVRPDRVARIAALLER